MKQLFITRHLSLLFMLTALFSSCGGEDKTKAEQTISFNPLTPHNLSEKTLELNATASSGLSVSFTSSDPSIASVSGKTASLNKAGTVTITASQAGNDSYFQAPSIRQTLLVNEDNNTQKESQTITFNLSVDTWTFVAGELALEATSSSGLPVTFSSTNPHVTISGSTLKLIYNGTHFDEDAYIVASQEGNDEYNAAPNVSKKLRILHEE
jgi:hypothetical protein